MPVVSPSPNTYFDTPGRLPVSLVAETARTGLRLGEALACLNVPMGPDGSRASK